MMIVCENCDAWQHNLCMGVTEDETELENVTYYCEQCKPQDHQELLAAIKRGEKPWVAKKAQREQEKKRKKGKKGKAGRQSARASEIGTGEEASPAPSATKAEVSGKRKHGENGVNVSSKWQPYTMSSVDSCLSQDVSATPSKDGESAAQQKRRKSSHLAADQAATSTEQRSSLGANRRSSAAGPVVDNLEDLEGQRKKVAEALSKDLKKLIDEESKASSYRIPDGHTASSLGVRLALQIENGIAAYNEDSKTYADQFRMVLFNLKNNKSLLHRLLSGSLEAEELGGMSSDDMASEELQRQMAKLKEEADKQSIMIQEEAPRVRKTHKGDEVIESETVAKQDDNAFSAPLRRRPTEDIDMPDADQPDDNRVELPEDVGRRPPLNVQTSGSPTQSHMRKSSSANFNIKQVWDSVHSPDEQSSRPLQQPPRRRSSVKDEPQQPPQSAIVDTDVDRLLDDDADNLDAEPVDPDSLWQGKIHMAGVGQMQASAKWVAGGDPSKRLSWSKLLPQTLEVNGRIPVPLADDYVLGMRNSRSPTDVSVLAVTPSRSDYGSFEGMFDYFHTRNRWGVFQTSHLAELKDMYLIPLEYGDAPFPEFLKALEDNVISADRSERTFLITLIVRSKSPPPSASATPQVNEVAPAQSPALPQTSYAPQGPPGPVNPDMIPPLAASILGEYITCPTVLLMLGAVPDMEETQLTNLRHILDRVPQTRNDITALSKHLTETMEVGPHAGS